MAERVLIALMLAAATAGVVGTLSLILTLPHFWPGVLLTVVTTLPVWYLLAGARSNR